MNYIKSPTTKKTIKIGGSSHKKFIKEGLMPSIEPVEVKKEETKEVKKVVNEEDDTKGLVQKTTKNAIKIFNQIKNGEIPIPDNMTDESLSQYLTECMYLELVKAKKIKKKKVVSESEDSESDE